MCTEQRFRSAWAVANSDQNLHWMHLNSQRYKDFSCGQWRTLIRLSGCAGWFKSSLGAHARRYVFSHCGWNTECVYDMCVQQRLRSPFASAQSDQMLLYPYEEASFHWLVIGCRAVWAYIAYDLSDPSVRCAHMPRHYENTSIQIYWNFHHQKLKVSW